MPDVLGYSDEPLKNEDDLAAYVQILVDRCEDHLSTQTSARTKALEFYDGKKTILAHDQGGSSVVSKDLRAVMVKLMPSIIRALFGGDSVGDYEATKPEQEDQAEQATAYVNGVVVPESGASDAIYDAVFDALVLETGILKHVAYRRQKKEVHEFTDLSDDAFGLVAPEGEVLDHEAIPDPDALEPNTMLHSFRLKRVETSTDIRLECVRRERFLIWPEAESIETSPIVGEVWDVTRSDLISMGYDKDRVAEIGEHVSELGEDSEVEEARKAANYDSLGDGGNELRQSMQEVRIYDVYVRVDVDMDGIAELYHVVYANHGAESGAQFVVLDAQEVDEAPYSDLVAEREAHQFEGHSVAEDVQDIQLIKTSILRSSVDNIIEVVNPQPAVDTSAVKDMDAVNNPKSGAPILLKPGLDARQVIQWKETPFIAGTAFEIMEKLDTILRDRTGITDASGGLDPESFQNTTATAAQLMTEPGIAQAEMVIKSLSKGIRKAFLGILKLVVAHHDKPQTIKVAGEWQEYDPRTWDTDLDFRVNVGLGAGSKERDIQALQVVLGIQREMIENFGVDNSYVKPEQLFNTIEKIVEATGLPSADPYFTKPDEQEIKEKMAEQAQQPSDEQQKLQAQMMLEDKKIQVSQQKEAAQRDADLVVKQAEIQADSISRGEQLQADQIRDQAKLQIEREKIASNERIKAQDRDQALQIALLKESAANKNTAPLNGDLSA